MSLLPTVGATATADSTQRQWLPVETNDGVKLLVRMNPSQRELAVTKDRQKFRPFVEPTCARYVAIFHD